MALRKARPFIFRPLGLTDSLDPTNSPKGAMSSLANLIPDPTTAGLFVPRPAAGDIHDFADVVSALLVIGDIAYGMRASSTYVGADEPFAFNLKTGTFLTIANVTSATLPSSQPTTGPWTPPSMAYIGGHIMVAHPGFGTGGNYVGWMDITGASFTTTVNTYNGGANIDGNPDITAVQPGMAISGAGIPAGSYVSRTVPYVNQTFGTLVSGDAHMTNVQNVTGIVAGQTIGGAGLQAGTTVSGVSGSTVTMSLPAINNVTDGSVTFAGATIFMNQTSGATNVGTTVTISGGTATQPLWNAGQMDRNPFPSVPTCVAQFNGRAYYGVADAVWFSDALLPLRRSDSTAVQVLTTQDGTNVLALAPLMLGATVINGGIVQALLVFDHDALAIRQITGDQSTSNLAMNALPVATGTFAPLTITICELGTAFMSPDGVRIVKFDGTVTDPIGNAGSGVTVPFIYCDVPSRACAAASHGVLRVTTSNGAKPGSPLEEYWYDLKRKIWTGPHSFPASLIQPWGETFLLVSPGTLQSLWQSDAAPAPGQGYVENGITLRWTYSFTLPDAGDNQMQQIVNMTVGLAIPQNGTVDLTATEMNGTPLSAVTLSSVGSAVYQQYRADWPDPLVFKQLAFSATALSAQGQRIGNISAKMQQAGYMLESAA